jgi:hypothetical protein
MSSTELHLLLEDRTGEHPVRAIDGKANLPDAVCWRAPQCNQGPISRGSRYACKVRSRGACLAVKTSRVTKVHPGSE